MMSLKWAHEQYLMRQSHAQHRAQLQQGEDTMKEQWDLVQPFIYLSCSEQTRGVRLRRACAPKKPLWGNLILVSITIPEALADVFTLGHPCHRSCPISLWELSSPGLEGRMQWFPAAASAGLTAHAAEMSMLFKGSLARLLKDVFASLATVWVSRWSGTENFPLWRHQINC